MYTDTSIQALTDRIGWAQPMQPTNKVLSAENALSTSGRLFSSYHAMCIVENVQASMPMSNATIASEAITNDVLNDFLYQLKKQAALKVLESIFESEAASYRIDATGARIDISGTDYDVYVTARPGLFNCAVGYQVAYDVQELMLTTSRSNFRERSGADRGTILVAQQGYRNAEGVLVSDGVLQKMQKCLANITGTLFPAEAKGKATIRNVSHLW